MMKKSLTNLDAILGKGVLTTETRKELGKKEFALPGKRAFPINDIAHARAALGYARHAEPSERETIRRKVYKKYPELKESYEERHEGKSPLREEIVEKKRIG